MRFKPIPDEEGTETPNVAIARTTMCSYELQTDPR